MAFLLKKEFLILSETPGGHLHVLPTPTLAAATNFGRGIKNSLKLKIKINGLT